MISIRVEAFNQTGASSQEAAINAIREIVAPARVNYTDRLVCITSHHGARETDAALNGHILELYPAERAVPADCGASDASNTSNASSTSDANPADNIDADATPAASTATVWLARTLVTPLPALSNVYSPMDVMRDISSYIVTPAHNGTCVNLYHADSGWHFGSRSSADIGDYQAGSQGLTWAQAFESAGLGPAELDQLDRDKVYTIVIEHGAVHPRLKYSQLNAPTLYLVAVMDRNGNPVTGAVSDVLTAIGMKIDTPTQWTAEEYKAAAIDVNAPFKLAEGVNPNYGWILRKPGDAHPDANVHMESSLMRCIRRTWYDLPKVGCYAMNISRATQRHLATTAFVALRTLLQNRTDSFNRVFVLDLQPWADWLHTTAGYNQSDKSNKLEADIRTDVRNLGKIWLAWCVSMGIIQAPAESTARIVGKPVGPTMQGYAPSLPPLHPLPSRAARHPVHRMAAHNPRKPTEAVPVTDFAKKGKSAGNKGRKKTQAGKKPRTAVPV